MYIQIGSLVITERESNIRLIHSRCVLTRVEVHVRVSKKAVQMLARIATYLSDRTSERTEMDVPTLKALRAEFLERGIILSRAAQAARPRSRKPPYR